MAKKGKPLAPKSTTQAERAVRDIELFSGKPPVLDGEKMNDFEKEVFLTVLRGTLEATNKSQPLNLAMNMEIYFTQATRTGLFLAGMHVRELRTLREKLKEAVLE